jgi:hypothetical protein
MKTGDKVKLGDVIGKIIRFQPKTGDLIVKDKAGCIHIFLATRVTRVDETSKK